MSFLPESGARIGFAIALLSKHLELEYRAVAEAPAFGAHFPRTKFFLRTVEDADDREQALEFKVRNEQTRALQRLPDELSDPERAGLATRVLRAAVDLGIDEGKTNALTADACRLLVVDAAEMDPAVTDEDVYAWSQSAG